MEEQHPVLNEEEMIEFIQNKLLEQGVIVKAEDIKKVFDLEFDFMVHKGIVGILEEEK